MNLTKELELKVFMCLMQGKIKKDELSKINHWLLQFIGESFMNFRTYIDKLKIDLPIAKWLEILKNSPRHSNAHEVALRKIEIEIYYKVKPKENIKCDLDPGKPHFSWIDQSTFGLGEEDLKFLYEELKLPRRIPDYKDDDMRRWRRPVLAPISWGNSHTEYWRAFPTAITLFAVVCALQKIDGKDYVQLLAEVAEFEERTYSEYYWQMIPETGP